ASGRELHKAHRLSNVVTLLAFSRDGETLFSKGNENDIRIWDVATWRERPLPDGPEDAAESLAYSPDGKFLASTCGNRIWLWEAATGKVFRKIDAGTDRVRFVTFSADGKSLISGTEDCTLHVWDPETGAEKRRIPGRGQRSEKVALSPDGMTVAAWD